MGIDNRNSTNNNSINHKYGYFWLQSPIVISVLMSLWNRSTELRLEVDQKVDLTFSLLLIESLDTLEEIVISSFKKVVDKNVRKIVYSQKFHPWEEEQLKYKIYIVPLANELQLLRLNFPVPDVRNQFNTPVSN